METVFDAGNSVASEAKLFLQHLIAVELDGVFCEWRCELLATCVPNDRPSAAYL